MKGQARDSPSVVPEQHQHRMVICQKYKFLAPPRPTEFRNSKTGAQQSVYVLTKSPHDSKARSSFRTTWLSYVAVMKFQWLSITKLYFLLMLPVKPRLAMAQLHVIFFLDLRAMEKHLLGSVDCQSRGKKGNTGHSVLTLLLKSNINHFHPYFISQSKCTARHDVNKAGKSNASPERGNKGC